MNQLFKLFFDICLLKKGPQDIPASNALFKLLIVVCGLVDFLILILSSDLFTAFLQACAEIILILGSSWGILYVAKKLTRFQQTVSALLATDALLSLIALPVIATLVNEGSGLPFLMIIILMIWHWVVSGHIFSHALEKPFTFGLGISFLYILVSVQVMSLLFPEVIMIE